MDQYSDGYTTHDFHICALDFTSFIEEGNDEFKQLYEFSQDAFIHSVMGTLPAAITPKDGAGTH